MEYKQTKIPEFFEPESVGPRNWGEEILIGLVPEKYSIKLLKYNPGFSGNLQMHRLKDECGYILEGELNVYYDKGDGELTKIAMKPGDKVYHFPPGAVHKEEAGPDGCTVLEISTPHFNDRIRMEEAYGLPLTDGLPTTEEDQVELR